MDVKTQLTHSQDAPTMSSANETQEYECVHGNKLPDQVL